MGVAIATGACRNAMQAPVAIAWEVRRDCDGPPKPCDGGATAMPLTNLSHIATGYVSQLRRLPIDVAICD